MENQNKSQTIIYQTKDGLTKLDVIISVDYRVKSALGTQSRIWATRRIKEYIVKGFTLDYERLQKKGYYNQ